jgi:hypothetical protein
MGFSGDEYFCCQCKKKLSKYDVEAERDIVECLKEVKVAYRNELRYRLEKKYPFHTVVDYAIKRLEEKKAYNDGLFIKRTNLPGRRKSSSGTPNVFYKLPNKANYGDLLSIMKKKMALSAFVFGLSSDAGFYAQYLWKSAFEELGYEILKEDAREFQGNEATIGGNIDFIAKRDDSPYFGVEVKNGLDYPDDLGKKFQIAVELDTIPVLVVRKVNPTVYGNIRKYGGLVKIYETAIYDKEYSSLIEECKDVLGLPLISLEKITEGTLKHIESILNYGIENRSILKEKNEDFLKKIHNHRQRLRALDSELRFI